MILRLHYIVIFLSTILLLNQSGFAKPPRPATHTDESRVPKYTLPDPLKFDDGKPVRTTEEWFQQRRPQILELFTQQVYGQAPPAPENVPFKVISRKEDDLNGTAIRQEIEITLVGTPKPVVMTMLLYLPKSLPSAPVFWILNFDGNHTTTLNPEIPLNPNWIRPGKQGVVNNRATEASRGARMTCYPVELLISRGYGMATAYYGDIDPDYDDKFQNGIHPAFYKEGQKSPAANEWGSISAWAWGLSRGLDVLEQIPGVDGKKVAVIGHSRLGKTALWAGAVDSRFAMVISNNSGCGGAALSRRKYGETLAVINWSAPHWFCKNFHQYNDREDDLPVDQHELVALIAPRPVYIASATQDKWADPKGEFQSAFHADPVYRFLGTDGLGGNTPAEMPAPDEPLKTGTIGYHIRDGKHDLSEYDWRQYLDFADLHFHSVGK